MMGVMRKELVRTLGLLLVGIVGLVGVSGYLFRALLLGPGKDRILGVLSARAGVPVEVAEAGFDVAGWYRLRPALDLTEVRVGNPAGFTGRSLLEAQRLRVRLALRPLIASRSVRVESLDFESPRLVIERNKEGISNLEKFFQGVGGTSGPDPGRAGGGGSLTIDRLAVTGGELRYPGGAVTGAELTLSGFVPGRPCEAKVEASMAGTKVHFEGKLGPFGGKTLAIDGRMAATVALAGIPEATRRREFGELLADPGPAASAAVRAELRGDLNGALSGPARVTLREILAGRDGGTKLRLDGEAPMQVSVRKALSTPLYDLKVRGGALRMGTGEWKGNVDLLMIGGVVRAKSSGSIRGVEMNEFLSAFTRAAGKVHGVFSMPDYTMRFGGAGAEAIRRSLSGTASLSIDKGRIQALDLAAAIRAAVEQGKVEFGERSGDTEFTTLQAEVSAANEVLRFGSLAMDGPAINAAGSGSITFAQALDFQLSALVRGRVAELLLAKPAGNRPAEARLPLRIGGTVEQPRVYPDLGRLARDTGAGYAEKVVREKVLTEENRKKVADKVREKLEGLKVPFPFGRKKEGGDGPGPTSPEGRR
jgi:hypothetical protein